MTVADNYQQEESRGKRTSEEEQNEDKLYEKQVEVF